MVINEVYCSISKGETTEIDRLNSRIASLNQRINELTPYEEKKTAYLGDSEVTFLKGKNGVIAVNCITESGIYIPVRIEDFENSIVVRFDPLEEVAEVTLSIQ